MSGLVRFCELECDVLALLKRATGGLCWVHPQVYYLFGVGCLFGVCGCVGLVVICLGLVVYKV